ncbi:MAG: endonuclease/exonuclease/phosphatase family protein [Myxococcales bacterium]|nr:endonuclease/exonuclease/phosphatase family protein [Myxococcales bacterium]
MTLSVLTLNLWHDAGPYAQRVELIREWIDRLDPDLIGFQEVLRGPDGDQAADLLAGRGYHVDFVCASPFWRQEEEGRRREFGNAVASRWPIADRESIRLPDRGDGEMRAAIAVTVDAPFGPVGFTCTHLNWKFHHGATREEQVVAVSDLALRRRPRDGFAPILVGDFNAEPESAEIRYLTGLQSRGGRSVCFLDAWRVAGDGGPGHTWSNRNAYARVEREPDRRIDYVFVGLPQRSGPGQLLSCRVVCNDEKEGVWPTDHLGVYAELRTDPLPDA